MGYIRHTAIVVTGDYYEDTKDRFGLAYDKAIELFGELVSNIVRGQMNGYQSFFIAPDGSKEGWEMSDDYDRLRRLFADYIDSLAYGDGSNQVQFVSLGYDEDFEVDIERTNKKKKDI